MFTANSCMCLALCVIFACAALQISHFEYFCVFLAYKFFQKKFSYSQNFFV